MPEAGLDPALVAAWLAARSTARGLPLPVADHGGLRVDTGLPTETRRYVFARPCDGLAALAQSVDDPLVPLKLCASPSVMASYVGPRWTLDGSAAMMACDTPMPDGPVPDGYALAIEDSGDALCCTFRTIGGDRAATGYAVERGGVFVFDRIAVDSARRRHGLGTAMMAALGRCRRNPASRYVLVATPVGRALYESLGWRVVAPYTTATLASVLHRGVHDRVESV